MQKKKTQTSQALQSNTPSVDEGQMWTRGQLSHRWSVSIMTLKRKERAGVLRAFKIGRAVRYRVSDILAFEAEAEVR